MFADAPINEPLPPIAEPTERQKNKALLSAPGTVAVRNPITGSMAAVKGIFATIVERIALSHVTAIIESKRLSPTRLPMRSAMMTMNHKHMVKTGLIK